MWKNAVFTCIWNHSVLQNVKCSVPNGQNSISRYFLSPSSKCRFVLFQYTNVFLWAKFGDLKPTIDEKRRPQIWTCFWARCRNKIPQGNQRGDQPSKNWENLDFSSDSARFLRSLVSAIRCEANKIHWRREERPIGSRAVKMLRDLLRRARGLAHLVAAANARAEVTARMHNWLIWC